ncbi:MAG: acylneuraminate cytidylyltransferase family protein [Bacteroidales bacterium]
MIDGILVVIPARGGSKGIPGKNTKELNGKPLIYYTIDAARSITSDENIYVTTDDDKITTVVEDYGLKVPFKRPAELATDHSGSYEVILHALDFAERQGKHPQIILLLQPTSPFRKKEFIEEAIALYDYTLDEVVSVKETLVNPYYNCFEESPEGFLFVSKGDGLYQRRQDAPKVYELNGSIYVINPESLKEKGLRKFTKRRKYVMDNLYSIDLDTMFDWHLAEMVIKEKYIEF